MTESTVHRKQPVSGTRVLLILAALVVVLVVIVWYFGCPRPEVTPLRPERNEPLRFDHNELTVKSADLEVGSASVRGAIHQSYLSWVVVIDCAEPEGCTGQFNVTIEYDTGSETRRITVDNRCDVPSGGELRFEGFQDPPTPVRRVKSLTLDVVDRSPPIELGANETEF